MHFERIDQQRALQLIADSDAAVVDIRDPVSFAAGHIRDAVHLTNDNVARFLAAADRSRPVIVCCYHGNSSQGAADFLAQQGFEQSFSLDGGFTAWRAAGLEHE